MVRDRPVPAAQAQRVGLDRIGPGRAADRLAVHVGDEMRQGEGHAEVRPGPLRQRADQMRAGLGPLRSRAAGARAGPAEPERAGGVGDEQHQAARAPGVRGQQVRIAARRGIFPRGPDREGELRGAVESRHGRQLGEGVGAAEMQGGAERAGRPAELRKIGFQKVVRTVGRKGTASFVKRHPEQQRRIRRGRGVSPSCQPAAHQRHNKTTTHIPPLFQVLVCPL